MISPLIYLNSPKNDLFSVQIGSFMAIPHLLGALTLGQKVFFHPCQIGQASHDRQPTPVLCESLVACISITEQTFKQSKWMLNLGSYGRFDPFELLARIRLIQLLALAQSHGCWEKNLLHHRGIKNSYFHVP